VVRLAHTRGSIHFRGGVSRGTNFLWEINGTDGDLQVTLGAPPIIQFAAVSLRRNGEMERKQHQISPMSLSAPVARPDRALRAGNHHAGVER
jgi:hypothetical protein